MSIARESSIDEREWQAQERGMGALPHNNAVDSLEERYRIVAKALESNPRRQVPEDFASKVAQLVTTRSISELERERALFQLLLIALSILLLIVVMLYAGRWWQSLHPTFNNHATGWLLASLSCLAVSWAFAQLHFVRDNDSAGVAS